MSDGSIDVGERLTAHLRSWVGEWPPPSSGVHVIGDSARLEPTWDGSIRPLLGVGNGTGTVVAVPPAVQAEVAEIFSSLDDGRAGVSSSVELGDRLGDVLGVGRARYGAGVFRTLDHVDASIPDLGDWFAHQTGELPVWLAPFNGPRLVARDDQGAVIAGVGIKIHDRYGYELAVVTEEAARGRGIARRLVATAARWVLEQGAVPTYLHDPANAASASVGQAVGFSDRGWTVHGLWPRG